MLETVKKTDLSKILQTTNRLIFFLMNTETITLDQIKVWIESLNPASSTFGTDLKTIRKALEIKPEYLANLLQVNRTTVTRWEMPGVKHRRFGSKAKHLKTVLTQLFEEKKQGRLNPLDSGGQVTLSLQAKCSGSDVATKVFTMLASVAEQIMIMEFKENNLRIVGTKKDRVVDFIRFCYDIRELCVVTTINIQ
jgi:DNA-binding transcriptional regulator YiaG